MLDLAPYGLDLALQNTALLCWSFILSLQFDNKLECFSGIGGTLFPACTGRSSDRFFRH
jgi:hypothetical protein